MFVYKFNDNEEGYEVGYWLADGTWMSVSSCDYELEEDAARRVNYLNGGTGQPYPNVQRLS